MDYEKKLNQMGLPSADQIRKLANAWINESIIGSKKWICSKEEFEKILPSLNFPVWICSRFVGDDYNSEIALIISDRAIPGLTEMKNELELIDAYEKIDQINQEIKNDKNRE